jgi:hypothetical protein
MKLSRTVFCSLVLAALTAGASFKVVASDADVIREAQDRAEIERLMWRYAESLDGTDEEGYASVYTPDGQFGTGEKAVKGHDALKKMITDLKKTRAEREAKGEPKSPQMRHMTANEYLEFIDKDHAKLHSYGLTVVEGGPGGVAPRVAAAGKGLDMLVRYKGRWLIQSRDVARKD